MYWKCYCSFTIKYCIFKHFHFCIFPWAHIRTPTAPILHPLLQIPSYWTVQLYLNPYWKKDSCVVTDTPQRPSPLSNQPPTWSYSIATVYLCVICPAPKSMCWWVVWTIKQWWNAFKRDDTVLHIKLSNTMKNRNSEGRKTVMGAFLDTHSFLCVCLILIFFSSSLLSVFSSPSQSCKLRRRFHLNGMHKPGDVVLGGLFEVHYTSVFPEWTFSSEPRQPSCQG